MRTKSCDDVRYRLPLLARLVEVGLAGTMAACMATDDLEEVQRHNHQSTYARLQSSVFDAHCATSSCHGGARQAGGLLLDAAHAYGALVDQMPQNPAAVAMGRKRVAPLHPEQSFLLDKLRGQLQSPLGEQMPWRAAPLDRSTLALVEAWIAAGAPKEGRVPGDDGGSVGGSDQGAQDRGPVLAPPPVGAQIAVTTSELPTTGEQTECRYLKLPSSTDLDVGRIEVATSLGAHHMHFYRARDPSFDRPDGVETCNGAVDFGVWQLIFATEKPSTDWRLPSGVAFHFQAGEQLLVETHYLASSTPGTHGRVLMNLDVTGETTQEYAGAIFAQIRDITIPPQSTAEAHGDCVFPRPLTIMAQAGHYHLRGLRFTVDRFDGTHTGEEIYHHEGYEDPPFIAYTDAEAPRFEANTGLEWSCLWRNDSDQTLTFGPTAAKNEHCNLFAFYHPASSARESIACVEESGASHTIVQGAATTDPPPSGPAARQSQTKSHFTP